MYLLFTVVLLVNILIAQMSKTFEDVWEEQEAAADQLFARYVYSYKDEIGPRLGRDCAEIVPRTPTTRAWRDCAEIVPRLCRATFSPRHSRCSPYESTAHER